MSLSVTCRRAGSSRQALGPFSRPSWSFGSSRSLASEHTLLSTPAAVASRGFERARTRNLNICDVRIPMTQSGIRQARAIVSATSSRRNKEERNQKQDPLPQPLPTPRGLSKALKKALPVAARENIYTLPNILTASRLVAAPFIGYCILHDHHTWALGLFAYAGITDLLDGWIARRWNQGTVVGTVIDPMADKALMTVLAVALAVKGALPVWLAVIILGRDVALGIAAIYYRWISLPPPKTFMRYWDFSLPSAEVHPTTISKYNTFLQLALMGVTTMAPVVPYLAGTPLAVMQYTVAVTTVWSGASYIYSKDAVKILSQKDAETKEKGKEKDKDR